METHFKNEYHFTERELFRNNAHSNEKKLRGQFGYNVKILILRYNFEPPFLLRKTIYFGDSVKNSDVGQYFKTFASSLVKRNLLWM